MSKRNSRAVLMISGTEMVGDHLVFEETALVIPSDLLIGATFDDKSVDLLAFHKTVKSLNLDKRDCELSIVQTDMRGNPTFKGSLKSTGMVREFMGSLLNKVVAHDLERATGVDRSNQIIPLSKMMVETMLTMGNMTELDKVGFRGDQAASFDGSGGLNMNALIDNQENVIHLPDVGELNTDTLHPMAIDMDNNDEPGFGVG